MVDIQALAIVDERYRIGREHLAVDGAQVDVVLLAVGDPKYVADRVVAQGRNLRRARDLGARNATVSE